jgi:Secretion system C-terminal sorting domain
MKLLTHLRFKNLVVYLFLIVMMILPIKLFAQNSGPKKWSIQFPKNGQSVQIPKSHLKYKNPNHKNMVFHLANENVTVYPNFRVHPSNFTQSEVPIVRGLNPDIIFGSANTIDPNTFFGSEGVYVSTDGGNSWFGSDTCKAASINDHGGDPGPGVGPDGRLYMSYLPGSYNSIKAAYSTNYGSTWSAGAVLQSGSMDKNHTAVDNITGSPYLGRAYVTWSDFTQNYPSISVSYTSNGGVSWSTYQHINTSASNHYSQGCNGAVGPGGIVYVAWQNPDLTSSNTGDFMGFGKSTDGGATWTYNNNVYDCNGIRGSLSFTGASSIRVNDFPWMAVDNTGGSFQGRIYIVTAEENLSPAGNDPDIVLHYSDNEGTNWSSGIRVNQDQINNGRYQYMPAVCVGEDGAVNVVYYDTRNATVSGGTPDSAQVYVSRSTDGGASFQDFIVSDHKFKPKPISGLASGYQGDYIGIVEANGVVYPYWCDDITGIYQAWTTQVTFEPPCGVDAASNPNPPSGTLDININLSQLTWSNGAGAVTNELYFGTNPASLDLVQSGSLSSYWNISSAYLPLNYYKTYYWKVVEIGATCSTSKTFSFKTMQNPNFHMVTDTLYPQNANYWTGYTDGTTKTDGEINTVDPNVGWAVFDVTSIPQNATITDLSFYGYVNNVSFPYWSATPMGSVNPVTANSSSINSQIQNNYGSSIAYIYSQDNLPTGWYTSSLGNGAISDLQSSLTQNWFAIGFIDWDFDSQWYINFDGWSQPNKPYLVVNYGYTSIDDPTAITATPVSPSQIDISFDPNANNNNVVLVWNLTGSFTTPAGAPPSPGQSFAGGTLLYNGIISPVHHSGLNPTTTYYYKLFSYDGTIYSSGITTTATTTTIQPDFSVNLLVHDNCSNSISLLFGTAPTATDCYDDGLDVYAPPPPPGGAFDGRFVSCNEGLFSDFKATNPDSVRIWDIYYQPAESCSPVTIEWNPAQLPTDGNFHLVDPITGNIVNVNMRTANSFSDSSNLGHLQIIYNYQICSSFSISNSWNLISLPLDVSEPDYLTLFPNAIPGTLYGYSDGYYTTDSIQTCTGYWLKFSGAETDEVCGTDRTGCTIDLSSGWNLIGGPNCNIPVSNIGDPGGIIIPGTIYGYSGGYFSASSIDATKGYYLKTNSAGTITLSCTTTLNAKNDKLNIPQEALDDFVKIDVSDAGNKNQTLYFNGKLPENLSLENFSMPPLPPQGSFDARVSGDYRLSENDNIIIKIQSRDYPINIKITIPDNSEKLKYILEEIANGVVISSRSIDNKQIVSISSENISELKIKHQQELPSSFELAQNYPNPFNPSTTIEFSLPEDAKNVKLTIYNTLGQKISELVNGSLQAGKYHYEWNAKNVATGIYIYELKTENHISIKKMLLLK